MRHLSLLCLAVLSCGPDDGAPAAAFVPGGTAAAVTGVQPDGGFVDPCAQINGRQWDDVIDTVVTIDNTDSRCQPPGYEPLGTVTVDALPVTGNRFGPCPITYTPGTRGVSDGGTEPTCHTTASCSLTFNGGATAVQTFDFTWNIYGGFWGTSDQISTGQLCPYVKLSTYRDGGEP